MNGPVEAKRVLTEEIEKEQEKAFLVGSFIFINVNTAAWLSNSKRLLISVNVTELPPFLRFADMHKGQAAHCRWSSGRKQKTSIINHSVLFGIYYSEKWITFFFKVASLKDLVFGNDFILNIDFKWRSWPSVAKWCLKAYCCVRMSLRRKILDWKCCKCWFTLILRTLQYYYKQCGYFFNLWI